MKKEYTVKIDNKTGKEIISYTEDGVLYSFIADPANSDYQAYLKNLDEADSL